MILLNILLIALFASGFGLALAHLAQLGVAGDSPWLLAHIGTALAAYALFAAAIVCAWLFAQIERNLKTKVIVAPRIPLLTLEHWMFAFVYAGFALLTLSLALGGIAGGVGFLFKLQHKTIFTALAWLCFAVLVWGRIRLGWRGAKAVRMVHFGSAFLLLAYVGTHFVLHVILKRGGA